MAEVPVPLEEGALRAYLAGRDEADATFSIRYESYTMLAGLTVNVKGRPPVNPSEA